MPVGENRLSARDAVGNKYKAGKKAYPKFAPPKYQKDLDSGDSSDSYSDEDEEDAKDYRVGGYHPVEIGEVYADHYKVLCKMGWGQYSTVWLVRDLTTSKLYALKIQRSATSYMEAAQDELKLFTEVMRCAHEAKEKDPDVEINVVALEDHFLFSGVNGTHMCFVYERLGGSLLDLIKHYDFKGIPSSIVRPLVKDMLSGLSFLHHCGIIHTDLKPENVLLKAPLSEPPPERKTMYDVVQESINSNPEVQQLQKQCESEELGAEEKKRLRAKLKKLRTKIRKSLTSNAMPTLWGFLDFNYAAAASGNADNASNADNAGNADNAEEVVDEPFAKPVLEPAPWQYPDDCFYIKMYVLCPLKPLQDAFGPCHGYGDEKRDIYSEWTFHFACDMKDEAINMFQIRGHGRDPRTRLHDIRHVIMNNYSIQDRDEHLLWSLRFDGRRIRPVFHILETLIPHFRVIHLPSAKYALSAYEHSMLVNAKREFLPPATAIFRNLNGALVGLFIPAVREGLRVLPLATRLSMWPSDAMLSKKLSDDRSIAPYFAEGDVVGCKVVDLGNACFNAKQFTNDIQTRQYRCPETILHTPYSYPADIWSAACVIFELLTGEYLFQPKEHGNVSRDLEQLALFEEVLGPVPVAFARSGKRAREFLNKEGGLKHTKRFAPHKIAYRLNKAGVSLEESVVVEDLLLQMLAFEPEQRLTAKECLEHKWFSS